MKPVAKRFANVDASEIANDRVLRQSFWTSPADTRATRPAEITDLAAWRARRATREA
jgi:hypothetical protein